MKKVYICSSLRTENYKYVTELLNKLSISNDVFMFRPKHNQLDKREESANVDVNAIDNCNEVWVIGQYGRDCSWEIGYATGKGLPIKVFKCEMNIKLIEDDWMMYAHANNIVIIDIRCL